MKSISTSVELKAAILELEKRKTIQQLVIKEDMALAKEALKPANIIKNTFSKLGENPAVRATLITTVVGFAVGYFAKKSSEVLSEQSLNRVMRNLVDYGADKLMQNNPESLLSKGIDIARNTIKENAFSDFKTS